MATEELPFRVRRDRFGNVGLDYEGTDARGTVQPYHRAVGPADEKPGYYHDALGMAVLKLLTLYERVKKERDEALEMLAAEPSERPRKKRFPENGKG